MMVKEDAKEEERSAEIRRGKVLDVKDSAEVTKVVVIMLVMEDVTEEAAELIFSVDAHISLAHSGGKP